MRSGKPGSDPSRTRVHYLAALAFFCLMAVLHTWPLASAPASLSRHDNADALLNEWTVAWVEHQLLRDPLHLFDANIFYPERNTLAFSEHMFVQSVMGLPLRWAGLSTTAVHNLLIIAGLALTGWATFVVMLRWTRDVPASVLSGCLMAFNAHTLTRLAHLQAMHVEFLPFAVLALDELLERPRVSAAVALALFFTLQGLTSNYLLTFTVFALAAALLVRPDGWWGGRFPGFVGPFLLAAALGAVAVTPFLLPYYWAREAQGLHRTLGEMALFSASWRDYLSTGGRVHFDTWSAGFWTGTGLFPGLVATALGLTALIAGLALRDRRARMWLAIGVAGVLLSFGPALPGYAALVQAVPLLQGIRAPVRFGFLLLAAVAMLGGFGLWWLRQRWSHRPRLATSLAVLAVLLVTAEAFRAPVGYRPAIKVPDVYKVLAPETRAVVIEYPMPGPTAIFSNARYMLYSTAHWKPLVNGYSGFMPASYVTHYKTLDVYASPEVLAKLVAMGVTHIVAHGSGRILASDRMPALTRLAVEGDIAIYRIDPSRIALGQ
jgi:hypothetical protein